MLNLVLCSSRSNTFWYMLKNPKQIDLFLKEYEEGYCYVQCWSDYCKQLTYCPRMPDYSPWWVIFKYLTWGESCLGGGGLSGVHNNDSWRAKHTYHSWWINLILPVQTQGWYRGLSGVPSERHTRQISAADTNKHIWYMTPIVRGWINTDVQTESTGASAVLIEWCLLVRGFNPWAPSRKWQILI